MSKKAIKTKELTSEEKIEKALKSNTKINELKLKRDIGDFTPEVLEMCKQHIDQMLEATKKKRSVIDHKELEKAAEQIKNDQELLVLISQFADVYDEVLVLFDTFLDCECKNIRSFIMCKEGRRT